MWTIAEIPNLKNKPHIKNSLLFESEEYIYIYTLQQLHSTWSLLYNSFSLAALAGLTVLFNL